MLGLSRRHRNEALERGRGREAVRPRDIPKTGWRDVLWRVWSELGRDNVSMIAAGVAFYLFLALFPAIAATVSIYGLVSDPQQIEQQVQALGDLLPEQARGILMDQLSQLAQQPQQLGWGAALAILLTLWSTARGMKALMTALDIIYDETESRGFVWFNALSLILTLGAILFLIATLALVVGFPAFVDHLGLGEGVTTALSILRWPLLAVLLMLGLSVLYRYAPDRAEPKWRWVTWGSAAAAAVWIVASLLFSWFVANFGNYNETYGSVAAVVILLLWLNLTAYVVLAGAELNSEMEHQTARDTTTGRPQPLGRRGAYVADDVGRRP